MTRINYTGRKRIVREKVQLRLVVDVFPKLYVDGIDLSGFDLPGDARIVVEAQRRTNFTRVHCGTVAEPDLASGATLREFDSPDGINFRVKVVGASGDNEGKLLAAADGLRATADGESADRVALLPVRPSDLGQLLWRLDIDDTGFPSLLINKLVPMGWNEFARQPMFRALVFPEVTRRVAMWVVGNLADVADNPESPAAPWVQYFKAELGQDLLDMSVPSDEADRQEWARDWADEVAEKFSRKHRILESIGSLFGDEQ